MGDENNLAGQTKAHKHTAPSSDGGFLETDTTGMTNLSQGSILKGNASEIQTELVRGNANDVLTCSATDISWVAPSGVTSTFEEIYNTVLTTTGGISTGSFSAPDKFITVMGYVKPSVSQVYGAQLDGDSGSNYDGCTMRNQSFGANYTNERSVFLQTGVSANTFFYFKFEFYNADTTDDKLIYNISVLNPSALQSYYSYTKWTNSTGAITSISLVDANSGGVMNFESGSHFRVIATPA